VKVDGGSARRSAIADVIWRQKAPRQRVQYQRRRAGDTILTMFFSTESGLFKHLAPILARKNAGDRPTKIAAGCWSTGRRRSPSLYPVTLEL
jgi:hypothetical protein